MSASSLLVSLLRYKAWADQELLQVLVSSAAELPAAAFEDMLQILGHAHVVDRIFVAHLQGLDHGLDSTDAGPLCQSALLFPEIGHTDQWLIAHVQSLDDEQLEERLRFRYTDGLAGEMSREEMLGHLIAHGGYHRGELGRLLTQHLGDSPPDTFTGYLRRLEASRRGQGWSPDLSGVQTAALDQR